MHVGYTAENQGAVHSSNSVSVLQFKEQSVFSQWTLLSKPMNEEGRNDDICVQQLLSEGQHSLGDSNLPPVDLQSNALELSYAHPM